MKMIHAESLEETQKAATDFVAKLKPNKKQATVVCMHGDLGAGKTSFVQQVATELGVTEAITSPTFVIQKVYPTTDERFAHMYHIDAYRIEDSKEMVSLGWEKVLEDPTNIVWVEWPDLIADILPEDCHKVELTFVDETKRDITIN